MMNNLFLDAANSKPTERPPVWMMRQAGRFMPQYWEIKNKYSFLTKKLKKILNSSLVKEEFLLKLDTGFLLN